MNQPEWISRTKQLLNLSEPPWFREAPRRFDHFTRDGVRAWFQTIPDYVGAIFVGACIQQHAGADYSIRHAIRLGFRVLLRKEAADVQRLWAARDHQMHRVDHSSLISSCYRFLNGILGKSPSIAFPSAFNYFVQNIYCRHLNHSVGSEIASIDAHFDPIVARKIWNSQAQREAFAALQSVFLPPDNMQPTTPSEWLIAADMLEEAGEVRAEAIRAAVNGANEKEVFATIYNALPPDLLT